MATSSLATDGYGSGATIAKLVREGYSAAPIPTSSLATLGYGSGATIASLITEGYSLYKGVPINPPTGKQYIPVAGLPWTGRSVLEGAVPAAANGDLIICDLVTPQGHQIQMNSDGTFNVQTDTDTARQSFVCDVFSQALNALHGQFTTWVNNRVPAQTTGLIPGLVVLNQAITPIDLSLYVTDPEADVVTYSLAPGSALPTGISLVGSVISGAPTSPATVATIIRVTDITGDFADLPPIEFAPKVLMPSIVNLSTSAAIAALSAVGLTLGTSTYVQNAATTGTVVFQAIEAGTAVDYGSSVNVSVSNGATNVQVLPPVIRLSAVGENFVTVTWDSTAGTFYVFLDGQRQPGTYSIGPVTIGGLKHPRRYRIAVSGLLPDGSESALSNEITFSTELRTLYFGEDDTQPRLRDRVTWEWR